jgi:hypothetical protein
MRLPRSLKLPRNDRKRFTPTFILPPQGGGNEIRVSPFLKGRKLLKFILPSRGSKTKKEVIHALSRMKKIRASRVKYSNN